MYNKAIMAFTYTSTKTSVRYTNDLEVKSIGKLLKHSLDSLKMPADRSSKYVFNLSEIVGVGRAFFTTGRYAGFINDAQDLLDELGINIRNVEASNHQPEAGETFSLLRALEIFIRPKVGSEEPKIFLIEKEIKRMKKALESQGLEISGNDLYAMTIAGQILRGEDANDWYHREEKYKNPDDLLLARQVTSEAVSQLDNYWDSEILPTIASQDRGKEGLV